ncbi:MAG TPA: hypothetical protein ENJ01_09075 [Gammaproteobacteria bacterium]|nr:hypothetical protein [Gammaproteobacteria bacterium]
MIRWKAWTAAALLALSAGNLSLAGDLDAIEAEVQEIENSMPALAPARVNVYVNLDVVPSAYLNTVHLKLDGRELVSYRYTERENRALREGGSHRIFSSDLRGGAHELSASFTMGDNGKPAGESQTVRISTDGAQTIIELLIADQDGSRPPSLQIRVW